MWVVKIAERLLLVAGISLMSHPLVLGQPPKDEFSIAFKLRPLDAKLESPVVTAMALSPDGKHMAAAGDDHAIRVIELENFTTIATLKGHTDWVRSVMYSLDGKVLASCGNDCELRVWQPETDYSGKVLAKGSFAWSGLAIHPDNDRIFVVGFGKKIDCWSISRGQRVWRHNCECSDNRAIDVAPNGLKVAWGGRDGKLCIFDLPSNSLSFEETIHRDRIRSIRFSSDSSRLTSIGEDRRLCVLDSATARLVDDQKVPGGKPMSLVEFDPLTTAIGGSGNGIFFYSGRSGSYGRIAGHRGTVSILCCDQNRLYSSGYDTVIRVWDKKEVLDKLEASPATKAVSTINGNAEAVVR